jgi:hypothetical protein
MAQNGLGKIFLCRSCCNEALRPLSLSLSRPFSNTPRRAKSTPLLENVRSQTDRSLQRSQSSHPPQP